MGSVAAKYNEAVELELVVVVLHSLDLIHAVLIGLVNLLERSTGRAEDCAAPRQYPRKVGYVEHPVLAVY